MGTSPSTLSDIKQHDLLDLLALVDVVLAGFDIDVLVENDFIRESNEAYLTGTYPPLKALREIDAGEVYSGAAPKISLYLHVPFCHQRCTFCHFAKEIEPSGGRVTTYLDALLHEIELAASELRHRPSVASVYVGGGTPSSLSPGETSRLVDAITDHFALDEETEFTYELHPQVVRSERRLRDQFSVLMEGGVNRIAFGAQTLDDRILRTLNRGHTADDVFRLIEFMEDYGFGNYSVDLMYGLPHETVSGWFATLSALVERGVTKLNIFPLFFKITDPISALYSHRPEVFPDLYQRLRTHFLTETYLTENDFRSGPALYYAKYAHHSRQQELKFDDMHEVDLLGLGVSSFGYLGRTQYYNVCTVDEYLAHVARSELPVWRGESLDDNELARRQVMFGLRSAGVPRQNFAARFGRAPEAALPHIQWFAELGLLNCVDDVWAPSDIGAYCVDGMAAKLASNDVRERVEATNRLLGEPRRSPIEQHDYSPLGRSGTSVPHPQSRRRRT